MNKMTGSELFDHAGKISHEKAKIKETMNMRNEAKIN